MSTKLIIIIKYNKMIMFRCCAAVLVPSNHKRSGILWHHSIWLIGVTFLLTYSIMINAWKPAPAVNNSIRYFNNNISKLSIINATTTKDDNNNGFMMKIWQQQYDLLKQSVNILVCSVLHCVPIYEYNNDVNNRNVVPYSIPDDSQMITKKSLLNDITQSIIMNNDDDYDTMRFQLNDTQSTINNADDTMKLFQLKTTSTIRKQSLRQSIRKLKQNDEVVTIPMNTIVFGFTIVIIVLLLVFVLGFCSFFCCFCCCEGFCCCNDNRRRDGGWALWDCIALICFWELCCDNRRIIKRSDYYEVYDV